MKHFILKENDTSLEKEEDDVDFTHKEEGYVIVDNEIYYIDDTYIRSIEINKIIDSIENEYNSISSEMNENSILEPYYQYVEVYSSTENILNEIRNEKEYSEIFEYIKEQKIESYDIEDIIKDSIVFRLREPEEYYMYIDDEISDDTTILEDWGIIELKDILNNLLKPINIYDSQYIELKEEYLTKAEIDYLTKKIKYIIGKDVKYDLNNYKKYGECDNEIYVDVPYTVYQIINFNTLKEKFFEVYTDANKKKWKNKFKDLRKSKIIKKEFPYPSREIYNDIQDFGIKNNSIKKIITYLYTKDKNLNKKYNYKELNPLTKKIPLLKSGMISPIKDNKTIVQLFPNGFTLSELLDIDSTLEKTTISNLSIFKMLKDSDLIIEFTKWNSLLQRVFLKNDNHVFQLNIRDLEREEKLFDYAETIWKRETESNSNWNIKKKVKEWQRTTGHPVSRKKITLAWIRFTKINDNEIVLDEIQTDLDDEDEYFGKQLMDGWEDIILSKFIKFVKYNLHINKIYYPNYITKKNKYNANPPTYLYSDLPKKYGFSSENSNLEGFMLLEKKITN